MPVHTRRLVGRRVHRRGVSRVVSQTADLVGEGHAQVEAPEIDTRAETAVEIGNRTLNPLFMMKTVWLLLNM